MPLNQTEPVPNDVVTGSSIYEGDPNDQMSPGNSCGFDVNFNPQYVGTKDDATLKIETNVYHYDGIKFH